MMPGAPPRGEWIGGRFSMPAYVMEPVPERPDIILWMHADWGAIVGMHLDRSPLGPTDVADALVRAIEKPSVPVGPPTAIRVADAPTADAIRARLGDSIPVRVAPTPELDAAMADLGQHMSGGGGRERSYLEGGRVPAGAVGWMFRAAATLWRTAPWRFMDDDHVLAVDVPPLGVHAACLSVIGALGQHFGFVLFESMPAYERFIAGAEGGRPDVSGMLLSLNFERRQVLPETMRREIIEHGWPVAGARAHPLLICSDADGVGRPHMERDVTLTAACAEAITEFAVRHREAFAAELVLPVRLELRVPQDAPALSVRLAFPHPARLDDVTMVDPAPLRGRVPVGRNDPCPCGSGRKYKRCHLPLDEARPSGPAARAAELMALDHRLTGELQRFARAHFGAVMSALFSAWERGERHIPREELLLVTWIMFHKRYDGRTLVAHFLDRRAARLDVSERAWLEAQRDTPLSVWQAVETVPDSHLVMVDLLTGERRTVYDRSASKSASRLDMVLARVVERDGVGLLCGLHSRPLPPTAADVVVRGVKRLLRTRASRVAKERLQDEDIVLALLEKWERAVEQEDAKWRNLRLSNTDGEPLLLTVDHFVFESSARAAIEERLLTIGEREDDPETADATVFVVQRDTAGQPGVPRRVLVARLEVAERTLRIETNSRSRADTVRRDVEEACADLIRHKAREHVDPRSSMRRGERPKQPAASVAPAEAAPMVLALKRNLYRGWLDEQIPALQFLTPREAVKRPASRRRLELLLQDMERSEARMPEEQRFDFDWVRAELGMSRPQ